MVETFYEETPPHPALRPHVRCLWRAVLPPCGADLPPWARVLPDGCTDIVVDYRLDRSDGDRLSGAPSLQLVGTMTRPVPFEAAATTEVLGLRFEPGGAAAFFPLPARELTDAMVPLAELWGGESGLLTERLAECGSATQRLRLLEETLLCRPRRESARARCAREVARLVVSAAGQLRVEELAGRSGYSRQYLARLFDEHVGVSPKLLARIERFSGIVVRARSGLRGGWAAAAAEHGYFDQAHFIHEFTEFAGVAPSAYFGRG